MKKGDLLEYVKILSKDKKQKILGKRSADDMLVFEVTRVERKKRGRKAAEFNEIEKENHTKTLAERKKARNINFRSKKIDEIV